MKKELWLIYRKDDAKRNHEFIESFIDEANKLGIRMTLKFRESFFIGVINRELSICYEGEPVQRSDAAIVRVPDPFFSEQLEAFGIRIFNRAEVSRLCNDKRKTHQALAQLQIPMVDTLFFNSGKEIESIPPFAYPFVVKGALGRSGSEVFYIQDKKQWQHACQKLISKPIVVQRVADQVGKDVRVFVIGKEIFGAVLRHSESDFKANYTLGGKASRYELTEKERQLIEKIIDAFPFDFVGIDFLFNSTGELLFNEIEDVVGSRTLYATSHINVAKLYINYIAEQLSET